MACDLMTMIAHMIITSPVPTLVILSPLSANSTKWSNTLKQLFPNLPKNCLSVFDHFVGLVLQGLMNLESRGI